MSAVQTSLRDIPVFSQDLSMGSLAFLLRLAAVLKTKPRALHWGYVAKLYQIQSTSTARSRVDKLCAQGLLAIVESSKAGVRLRVLPRAWELAREYQAFLASAFIVLEGADTDAEIVTSIGAGLRRVELSPAHTSYVREIGKAMPAVADALMEIFEGYKPLNSLDVVLAEIGESASFVRAFAEGVLTKSPMVLPELSEMPVVVVAETATICPEVSIERATEAAAKQGAVLPVLSCPNRLHADVAQRLINEFAIYAPTALHSPSFSTNLPNYVYAVLGGSIADYGSMIKRLRIVASMARTNSFSPARVFDDELYKDVVLSCELFAPKGI